MNNISSISVNFSYPWLLLIIIPAVALALFPYLRLKPQHRRTRNRVVSLVIHIVILVLSVSMLSGMTFHTEKIAIKNDVILLVDASKSNQESTTKMNEFIQSILKESNSEYNIGIITFANGNIYAAKQSTNSGKVYDDYISQKQKPDESGTNIADALTYAVEQLQNPQSGRIILMTDGIETDGKALGVTQAIAKSGTRIDAVFFPPQKYDNEVQILSVAVPTKRVTVGETVQIDITLQSSAAGFATLSLFDNAEACGEKIVSLSGGKDIVSFEYTFTTPKLHELNVKLTSQNDTITQNNQYYSFVNIEVFTKVLILEKTPNESAMLNTLLAENYNADVLNIADAPKTKSELQAYDEVILLNVANSDLPTGFDELLSAYVHDFGGGLFTVGGNNAYKQSDMAGSLFGQMLPVESTTEPKPLALMLVIDTSSSMNEPVGNQTRLDLAKAGAIASINALKDSDYVGIVTFSQTAKVLAEITPATQKAGLIAKINKIQTEVGTQYFEAIDMAGKKLKAFDKTDLKHMMFITDGNPQDDKTGYPKLITSLNKSGITLSTIAMGGDIKDLSTLELMAELGKGRCYGVENSNELPAIMQKETQVASGSYLNETPFKPTIKNHTPAVAGVTDPPTLKGYYGTKAKDGSTVILAKDADPIYADWKYGLGRVGSFTSDLSGAWSGEYFTDKQGITLINNIVYSLFPSSTITANDINVELSKQNYTSIIRISTPMENGETLQATITSPSHKEQKITLNKASANSCVGEITTTEVGLYQIDITKKDSQNKIISTFTTYSAFSYSAEYNAFADEDACFNHLQEICLSGEGKILYSAEGMFGRKAEVIAKDYNPQLLFLIMVIILFLLDIAVRKFKFKWPTEIIRDYKAKK